MFEYRSTRIQRESEDVKTTLQGFDKSKKQLGSSLSMATRKWQWLLLRAKSHVEDIGACAFYMEY